MNTALPYPEPGGVEATAGHSGSQTSQERAVREARDGTMQKRQKDVYAYLRVLREQGLTVKDLRDITGWHHGQASSVLSSLHKSGYITRLTERRDRCQVYVDNEFINGREEATHRANRPKATTFEPGDTFLTVSDDGEMMRRWVVKRDGFLTRQVEEKEAL